MQIPESKAQMYGGTILAIFALVLFFLIIPAEIVFVTQKMGVSPRYFPNALAWMLFAFSVGLVVDGYRSRNKKKQRFYAVNAKEVRIVFLTLGIIALQIIGFDTIGYLIPAGLALAACMYLYGQRNYLIIILISVLLPFGIKLFFENTLQVYLP